MRTLYVVYNGGVASALARLAQELAGPDTRVRGLALTRSAYTRVRDGSLDHESLTNAESVHSSVPATPPDSEMVDALEAEYGEPWIQQFAVGDPAYADASYDRRRAALVHWFSFFQDEFADFSPDLLLTNRVDGAYVWIPHCMTISNGGTVIRWTETRIGTRYACVRDSPYEDLTGVRRLFRAFERGERDSDSFAEARTAAREYIDQFGDDAAVRPGYFERRQPTFGRSVLRTFVPRSAIDADARRSVLTALRGDGGYHTPDLRDCLDRYASRVLNRTSIAVGDPFSTPDSEERYVFFPLHAQPEASTYVLAQAFMDQVALVRQVSRSLPANYRLYVKDHPRMFRDNPRPLRTYRALAAPPNVRLLDPALDSHALIRGSDCVVTVTGTPGLEGVLHGTPAVLFGRAHFDLLDGVERCECPPRLPEVFDRLLSGHTQSRDQLERYLTAVFARSVDPGTDIRAAPPSRQRAFAVELLPEIRRLLPDGQD